MPSRSIAPATPATAGLDVEGLTKTYRGGVVANDEVGLRVEPGEVYALLSPNGAARRPSSNRSSGCSLPIVERSGSTVMTW